MPRRTVRKILSKRKGGSEGKRHSLSSTKRAWRRDSRNDLSDVGRDEVPDELLSVVVDRSSLLDSLSNGSEVIAEEERVPSQLVATRRFDSARREKRKVKSDSLGENHISSELRDVGSSSHGDSNVSRSECRSIVDTVSSLRKERRRRKNRVSGRSCRTAHEEQKGCSP